MQKKPPPATSRKRSRNQLEQQQDSKEDDPIKTWKPASSPKQQQQNMIHPGNGGRDPQSFELALKEEMRVAGAVVLSTHVGLLMEEDSRIKTDPLLINNSMEDDEKQELLPNGKSSIDFIIMVNVQRIVTQFALQRIHYCNVMIPPRLLLPRVKQLNMSEMCADQQSKKLLWTWIPGPILANQFDVVLYFHQGEIYRVDVHAMTVRYLQSCYGYEKAVKHTTHTMMIGSLISFQGKDKCVFIPSDLIAFEGVSCVKLDARLRLAYLDRIVAHYNSLWEPPSPAPFFIHARRIFSDVQELAAFTGKGEIEIPQLQASLSCKAGHVAYKADAPYGAPLYELLSEQRSFVMAVGNVVDTQEPLLPMKQPSLQAWEGMRSPHILLSVQLPTEVRKAADFESEYRAESLVHHALFPFVHVAGTGHAQQQQWDDVKISKPQPFELDTHVMAVTKDLVSSVVQCAFVPHTGEWQLKEIKWKRDSLVDEKSMHLFDSSFNQVESFHDVVDKLMRYGANNNNSKYVNFTLAYIRVNGGMLACRHMDPRIARSFSGRTTPPPAGNCHPVACSRIRDGQKALRSALFLQVYSNHKLTAQPTVSCKWLCSERQWEMNKLETLCERSAPGAYAPAMYFDDLIHGLCAAICKFTLTELIARTTTTTLTK